jgi:hypothetical protein
MRFKDLSQEAVQSQWRKWKNIIREVLDECNQGVFHGRGAIRENTHKEIIYLLLETDQECLYVFPIPGNILIFKLCQHKIAKEDLKSSFGKFHEENIIGTFSLGIGGVEPEDRDIKKALKLYLKSSLRTAYKNYWLKSSQH